MVVNESKALRWVAREWQTERKRSDFRCWWNVVRVSQEKTRLPRIKHICMWLGCAENPKSVCIQLLKS